MKQFNLIAIVLAITVLFGSCATIANGSRAYVSVNTDNPNGRIYIDGQYVSTGDYYGKIKRKGKSHPVKMTLDGKTVARDAFITKTQAGWVAADIFGAIFTWVGVGSLITDGVTGSWKKIENPEITLESDTRISNKSIEIK